MKGGGILFWMVREQFNEKVTLGQRPEGGKGVNPEDKWRRRPSDESVAWCVPSMYSKEGWRVVSEGG